MFVTYLTIYDGNLLPPFYIGSTSFRKYEKGYRGSVLSKKYKSIWDLELKDNPQLFDTIILTEHKTRKEAVAQELKYQKQNDIINNSKFINMAFASRNFGGGLSLSPEHKVKLSLANLGKLKGPQSKEHKANLSASKIGKHLNDEHKIKLSLATIGRSKGPQSEEHKAKLKAAIKNRPIIECPHCNKVGYACNLIRWHNDNCKQFKCP